MIPRFFHKEAEYLVSELRRRGVDVEVRRVRRNIVTLRASSLNLRYGIVFTPYFFDLYELAKDWSIVDVVFDLILWLRRKNRVWICNCGDADCKNRWYPTRQVFIRLHFTDEVIQRICTGVGTRS